MSTPRLPPKFSARSFFSNGAKVGAPFAAIAGFLADIASPIFAFPKLFLALSLAAFVGLCVYWLFWKRTQIIAAYAADGTPEDSIREQLSSSRWFKALAFSLASVIISACFNVAAAVTPDEQAGFFAQTFEKIGELQDSLFDLKKDNQVIIGKLDEISTKFDNLPKGGLIANPSTPQDFYHNAKVYELDANFSQARQAYGKYLEFKLDFIDPHLSYQKLLRVQDGVEGAREVYDFLVNSQPNNVAIRFSRLLLDDAAKRKEGFAKFIADMPEYSPAYYWLSVEHSEAKLGAATITDKKIELEALAKLMPFIENGAFLRHFIDKNTGLEYAEEAKKRYAKAKLVKNDLPAALYYSVTQNGAILNIVLQEAATDLWYRIGEQGEFKHSGKATWVDQRLGTYGANLMIIIKSYAQPFDVWIKYKAQNESIVGPFAVKLSPLEQLKKTFEQAMQHNPEWVTSFRKGNNTVRGSVVPVSWKSVLKEIRYSLDSKALDKVFPFVPVPITEVSRFAPNETNVLEVPETTKKIYMQLTLKDGTRTAVNVSTVNFKE